MIALPATGCFVACVTFAGMFGPPSLSPASQSPGAVAPGPTSVTSGDDPDELYAGREHPGSALRAVEIWQARADADPSDIESGWKLARGLYWLGTNGPGDAEARKQRLRAGVDAARRVIASAPDRPEGHFWMAASMGALAESHGITQGLRYRGAIRDALERVIAIDPAYLQGSADRALGRWHYKVPRLFGGNKQRSLEHLQRALTYNPQSVITHLFLAETLIELDRTAEAREHLRAAIDAPVDPAWAPEDRRFQQQARELLASLR